MVAPRILRFDSAQTHELHGEGRLRKLVYPATVGSRSIFVGIAQVPPGEAPHVFHKHGTEIVGDLRMTYAEDFEEFYFVVEGSGHMEWVDDGGTLHREPVAENDTVFMPPGCDEHRIFNSGAKTLRVLYGGSPPAHIERLDAAEQSRPKPGGH